MKKLSVLLLGLMAFVVVGCSTPAVGEGEVALPDLDGYTQEEIIVLFDDLNLRYEFTRRYDVELSQSNEFIEYGRLLRAGDVVQENEIIPIIVSATLFDERIYFQVADIPYDGPYLDETFFDLPWYEWHDEDERYKGGGGAFEVEYNPSVGDGRCIDGDTTVFIYPQVIFDRITSRTPSTRYLNLDTPETWSGGEEAYGKQATEYVCDLLDQAERIVLQTDPGDNLTGNYGRLLAWVWIQLPDEDEFFLLNYMIVRQGLGEVAYLFGAGNEPMIYDGMSYTYWMWQAENLARSEGRGLFGDDLDWYWDYDDDRPYPGRW